MEDKKLLYGILAVCVVTLVVSGVSVYEVNTVAKQLNTQGEQIAALEQSQLPQNVIMDVEAPEAEVESVEVPAELKKIAKPILREPEANVESEDVEETPDEGINPNGPPENRVLMPAEESKSAIDAVIVRDAG